jgi:hypothetical protein
MNKMYSLCRVLPEKKLFFTQYSHKGSCTEIMKLYVFIFFFNVHRSVHRKNILIYIQQDATLHSLFYVETALHVLGGTTTHHQERKQMYLQHLVFV